MEWDRLSFHGSSDVWWWETWPSLRADEPTFICLSPVPCVGESSSWDFQATIWRGNSVLRRRWKIQTLQGKILGDFGITWNDHSSGPWIYLLKVYWSHVLNLLETFFAVHCPRGGWRLWRLPRWKQLSWDNKSKEKMLLICCLMWPCYKGSRFPSWIRSGCSSHHKNHPSGTFPWITNTVSEFLDDYVVSIWIIYG